MKAATYRKKRSTEMVEGCWLIHGLRFAPAFGQVQERKQEKSQSIFSEDCVGMNEEIRCIHVMPELKSLRDLDL